MLKRLRRLFKREKTSADMLNELRRKGAVIGEDVHIYAPNHTRIDQTSPFLLKIGSHVRITEGVVILTHDYAWSVLKCCKPEQGCSGAILGAQSPVEIGNHVFIGMNTIITRGAKIGDRVIIGAGSVVTGECESDSVYAGNPARKISTLEAYYQKRKSLQFSEARQIALNYRERFNREPAREVFDEYFMLFATREEAEQTPAFRRKMELLDSYEATAGYMDANPPMFDSYEAFLKTCYDGSAHQAS